MIDFKTFLENFDAIAEAPGGIPKLRSLILDLAVWGKLVPQNPEDEPASFLLEKINFARRVKWEKKQLEEFLKKGKEPNNKTWKAKYPEPDLLDVDDLPNIPESWEWCSLSSIAEHIVDGTHHTPTYVDNGIPFISAKDIINGQIHFETCRMIPETEYIALSQRCNPQISNLLVTKSGTIGRVAIVKTDKKFTLFESVALIPLLDLVEPDYIAHVAYLSCSGEFGKTNQKGMAVRHLHLKELRQLPIPLPPLAEQKRIVEKVDELMGLCDRYEAAKQTRDNLRQKLRESAIASLMNVETDEELDAAWAFVRDNWQNLSQHTEDVDGLRQAVLQLAYSGKLTERLQGNISVNTLLTDIIEEKQSLLKQLNFRNLPNINKIDTDEELFLIPREWEWIRIGQAFLISSGTTPSRVKAEYFEEGTEYWVKTTDLNNGIVLDCEEKITKAAVEDCNLKYYPVGTVCVALYGGAGTIGKSGLLGIETTINQSVCGIYPNKHIYPKYFHWYIKLVRPVWMRFAASLRKAPNINAGVVNNMVFPLAPFEEQKRIVAKIDELMQLCDQLEESLHQSQQRAESLAASAISHLTI